MEQLIPIINWLKTNRFWLLCGSLAVAMVAMWFVATQSVTKEAGSRTSEIKSKLSTGDSIVKFSAVEGKAAHPNPKTHEGMDAEINASVDSIMEAWTLRYDAQRNIFKWPDVLSNDFKTQFDKYSPPETFPIDRDYTRGLAHLLEPFQSEIEGSMSEICGIIDTRWYLDNTVKIGGDSTEQRGQQSPVSSVSADLDNSVVVKWNEENQKLWFAKLSSFKGRDDNQGSPLPSPLQVYMLQQDLSLLRGMFNIIANVNRDDLDNQIDAHDFARIKSIDHVAFGRDLDPLTGSLEAPDAKLAGANAAAVSGRSTANDPPEKRGGAALRGRAKSAVSETDPFDYSTDNSPFHGRYVDATYTRIPAETVRKILKDQKDDPKNLELIVAKRVPVRIAMRMDERYIDDFIAESANSPVVFEINQVRINKHEPMEGIKLGGTSGDFSAAADGGDDRENELASSTGSLDSGTGGSGATSASGEIGPVETRTTYDVTVEFYGIIKIYNPPNRERLEGKKNNSDADSARP